MKQVPETLVEENKRKLNEAKMVETELMDDESDIDTGINKTALPSSRKNKLSLKPEQRLGR